MTMDQDNDEWEEQYVFVELIGMVDPDKLSLCKKENTAILGVDSDMTVLKLGGHAFAGTYEDACGSMVIFKESEQSTNKSLQYYCHTTKVLKASRVFLKPIVEAHPNELNEGKEESKQSEEHSLIDHMKPSNTKADH